MAMAKTWKLRSILARVSVVEYVVRVELLIHAIGGVGCGMINIKLPGHLDISLMGMPKPGSCVASLPESFRWCVVRAELLKRDTV